MANQYLASVLIEGIRDSGMIPPAAETGLASRLLGFMNREQRVYLTKLLMKAREEYLTFSVDTTVVSTQTRYPINTRAIGAKLKIVEAVGSGSSTPIPLNPVPREDVFNNVVNAARGDYYIENNSIVLITPLSTGTLRMVFFRRMNKIVDAAEAGEVASFSVGAKTITLATLPVLFSSTQRYDVVQGKPHFDTIFTDQTATLAASTLTFTNSLPSDLVVGDFVSLAGETPICQAPLEMHDVLVQRSVVKYLEAIGDPKVSVAKGMLDELAIDALSLITPRVEGSPQVLINYNAPGWNRFFRNRRRRLP